MVRSIHRPTDVNPVDAYPAAWVHRLVLLEPIFLESILLDEWNGKIPKGR